MAVDKKRRDNSYKNRPSMPLSTLQKRWLKAVSCDPRVRLFGEIQFDFPDVEPLFLPSDVIIFDQYNDGDPYQDPAYIAKFSFDSGCNQKKIFSGYCGANQKRKNGQIRDGTSVS